MSAFTLKSALGLLSIPPWPCHSSLRRSRFRCHGPPLQNFKGYPTVSCAGQHTRTKGRYLTDGEKVRWAENLTTRILDAPHLTTFNWIVDDIVCWTGETHMCSPGGGGVQTAFGATMARCSTSLSCRVGDDFPENHYQYIENMGVVLNLIHIPGASTPRAWQLIEENGLRTQVWRTDPQSSSAMLTLDAGLLSCGSPRLQGVQFASSPLAHPGEFVELLKQQGAVLIGHEVYTHSTEAVDNITASRLVNAANFFSPNMLEARCLLQSVAAAEEGKPWQSPPSLPAEVCLGSALDLASDLSRRFGNQNVLLRCGSLGAVLLGKDVSSNGKPVAVYVPAYFTSVLDSTGCGNTFLGAFNGALLVSDGAICSSMCIASAAASVMGEHAGVPPLNDRHHILAYQGLVEKRAAELRPRLRLLELPEGSSKIAG